MSGAGKIWRGPRRIWLGPLHAAEARAHKESFMQTQSGVVVIVLLMLLAIVLLISMLARLYRKAGPHEALVVYGFRGTRIVKGRGTVIFPMIEYCRLLSLELMSFDVAPQQDLYTRQGVAVTVEAVAQIKVKSDPESIQTANQQFLTKS